MATLDPGERDAILLVEQLEAGLILLDDYQARRVAQSRNLRIIGLLGILDEAAMQRLVDLPTAIDRLQTTNFRVSDRLIRSLLERYKINE